MKMEGFTTDDGNEVDSTLMGDKCPLCGETESSAGACPSTEAFRTIPPKPSADNDIQEVKSGSNMKSVKNIWTNSVQEPLSPGLSKNSLSDTQLSSSTKSSHNTDCDRLCKWREAGKALREALSRLVVAKQPKNSSSSPALYEHGGYNASKLNSGNDQTCFAASTEDLMNGDAASDDQSAGLNDQMHSLARSMEQSMQSGCLTSDTDPMNQMWEDYQDLEAVQLEHVLKHHGDTPNNPVKQNGSPLDNFPPCEPLLTHSNLAESSVSVEAHGDGPENMKTEFPCTNDREEPTLSELRERMRKLVSNLPVLNSHSQGISNNSEKRMIGFSGNGNYKSPRNSRRRPRSSGNLHRTTDHSPAVEREGPTFRCHKSPQRNNVKTVQSTEVFKCQCCHVNEFESEHGERHNNKSHVDCNQIVELDKDHICKILSDSDTDEHIVQRSPRHKCKKVVKCSKSSQTLLVSDNVTQMKVACTKKMNVDDKDVSSGTESELTTNVPLVHDESSSSHGLKSSVTDRKTTIVSEYQSPISQTESISNFADIESCESEDKGIKESTGFLPNNAGFSEPSCEMENKNDDGCKEEDMPSLISSSTEEEEMASLILKENNITDYQHLFEFSLENSDDLDPFNEIPDLVISTDSSSDELNIELSGREIDVLQDICISDTSEEGGIEADDEFECDCSLCQFPRDLATHFETENQNSESRYDNPAANVSEEDLGSSQSLQLLTSLRLLVSDNHQSQRDVLDLMFTNVIMHMLSVYPDLLADQSVASISEELFDSFPRIDVTQEMIDEEGSCPICLCNFALKEDLKQLQCSHYFHVLCIQAWLKTAGTCPVCRHNLTEES